MNKKIFRLLGVIILLLSLTSIYFDIGNGFLFGFLNGIALGIGLVLVIKGKFKFKN